MAGQVDRSFEGIPVRTVPAGRERRASNSRRRTLVLLSGAAFLAVGWAGYWYWSIESGLQHARRAVDRGDWKLAREHLADYLDWHPQDSAARLLMAEAFVKDDTGESADFVQRAIRHLQQIGDSSPQAAQARLQEARLALLILQQPARAERLLRESLKLDPDAYEGHLLMWKVLDLTGRHIRSREFFWRVYELSPEPERPLRLRDWFLAEFYPETANEDFHRALGARSIGEIPASVNLWVRFRESEPEATFIYAALADYYRESWPKSSLELLKEAPDLAQAMEDPFFVAVLFESLVDLGEFQKARTCFEQFPAPRSGYLFWRSEGMFQQHVQDDPGAAVHAYRKALGTWPAKFDWGLMTRLSECLRKLGRNDEAQRVHARVKYLTLEILTKEKASGLRSRLRDLRDADVAREARDFYQEFGLAREATAWEEHRQNLVRLTHSSSR